MTLFAQAAAEGDDLIRTVVIVVTATVTTVSAVIVIATRVWKRLSAVLDKLDKTTTNTNDAVNHGRMQRIEARLASGDEKFKAIERQIDGVRLDNKKAHDHLDKRLDQLLEYLVGTGAEVDD